MLYPYRTTSKTQVPCAGLTGELSPGAGLLALVYGCGDWLETPPAAFRSAEGKSLTVLYENTAFLVDEFLESFGRLMAAVSRDWPIRAFGTAPNQETVRLTAEYLPGREAQDSRKAKGRIELVQQSMSGKETDSLQTLCLQILCPDEGTASRQLRLLSSMNWRTNVAVMEWGDAGFLSDQKLIDPGLRSFFCYAGAIPHEPAAPDACLHSLNFPQKVSLWRAFLQEKREPVEFDWLADEIAEGNLRNRMEWELALREAMEELQFRVVIREDTFELFDGSGRRLYFSVDCRSAAERALMKILFPLNFQ